MSPMPKKQHLESDTKAKIQKMLDEHGWFWWNGKADMYGRSGASDRMAFRDGIFMAIEAKRGSAAPKPTELQVAFLNSIRAHRGFGFVVNDARLPVLKKFLVAFDSARYTQMKKQEVSEADGAMMLDCIRVMTQEL